MAFLSPVAYFGNQVSYGMRATRQEGTFTAPGRAGEAADCVRITELLSRVGDKWTVLARLTISNAGSTEEACRRHAAREEGGLRTGGARDFSAP
jgi:hypothetical protein